MPTSVPTSYNYTGLRNLWIQAGGDKGWSYVMAAIAMAESGGRVNPPPHLNTNNTVDYGLWQINSIHGYDVQKLRDDPLYNARAAVSIFNSGGPHEWSTYNNGDYKKYMPQGKSTPTPAFGIYTTADYLGTDQGVDFGGKGAIPALDDALVTDVGRTRIVETGGKEWNYVIYLLRTGPYKGHFVYVAENIKPEVHPGQVVTKGQEIAKAPGGYPYTETGFNRSQKGWSAFGNLNGPQPSGQAMKDYIYGIIGQGAQVSVADVGSTGQTTGQLDPSNIITGAFSGLWGGIQAFGYQIFFGIIGTALIVVGLALVAWALLQRVGAPGLIGMAQTQMRIGQAGSRLEESSRAGRVREDLAQQRIRGQQSQRQLSRERLEVQERHLARRESEPINVITPVQTRVAGPRGSMR